MAYECPRCGGPVQRGSSSVVGLTGGLVGALIFSAFGSFQCKKCGSIPKSEFPPEVQQKMTLGSVGLVVAALVVLALVIGLLIFLASMRT